MENFNLQSCLDIEIRTGRISHLTSQIGLKTFEIIEKKFNLAFERLHN